MKKKTRLKILTTLPLVATLPSFGQNNNENIVKFKKWQVQYYTPVVSVTTDEEHSIWIAKPPLFLEAFENESIDNSLKSKISVYMQGIEGECATFLKEGAAQKGVRFFVSTSIVATLFESYSSFNDNITSNIYALVRDLNSKTCLKLYFYNETETKIKIGFNEHNGEVGSLQIKEIIKTAKLINN